MTHIISRIDGVLTVELNEDQYRIGCSRNVAPVIAKSIIEQGLDLTYLNKTEYGLSDIYHHYFNEQEHHEEDK